MALPRRGTLTIPSGDTDSPWMSLIVGGAMRSFNFLIGAPATLTGTITIQTAEDDSGTRSATLQSPAGTDVNIAAGKSVPLSIITAGAIRLHSSGAEGGARVFSIQGAAVRG